jgi:hypothetical protein
MKSSTVLFVGSLGLNAVLLGMYVTRRAEPLSPTGAVLTAGSTTAATAHPPDAVGRDPKAAGGTAPKAALPKASHWAALDSPDLPTLIARLRAAGFPANIVREIVSARIDALFASRMKEIAGTPAGQPYWKAERLGAGNSQFYEAMNQLYRDRAKMLREALADPFFADAPLGAGELERRRQFGSLPKDKTIAVQRIADDYAEMASKINAATGGIVLPEDREQLALLEREKRADLATVLSPQELAEYEMRTSPVTSRLRAALTLMDATEEEFRAIYAVQQPYADVLYPGASTGFVSQDARRRQEVAQQVAEQLKAVLGEERYADYERANSREFQQLDQIAQRENVSREAAVQAYTLRDSATRESNRIFDDKTLTTDQKRAALQALAQNTKTQMRNTLGPAAGDAYIRAADWVNAIENGRAVSFGAGGTTRMRGLPLAGNTRP